MNNSVKEAKYKVLDKYSDQKTDRNNSFFSPIITEPKENINTTSRVNVPMGTCVYHTEWDHWTR